MRHPISREENKLRKIKKLGKVGRTFLYFIGSWRRTRASAALQIVFKHLRERKVVSSFLREEEGEEARSASSDLGDCLVAIEKLGNVRRLEERKWAHTIFTSRRLIASRMVVSPPTTEDEWNECLTYVNQDLLEEELFEGTNGSRL